MDVAPGTRIGRYTVEALLGRGGMASVFRVRHDELGTHYALKLLHLTTAIVRERLVEEGRIQSRLRHPNVVSVFDVVLHQGSPGLVMEYIDGPSLHLLIHSEPPIPAAVRDALVTGIVYGVRAAHNMGLVHRDLKPANILLARTDEALVPKVADFGLAKAMADDASPHRRTIAGSFLGTPVYMAPEQVRNARDVDTRADVYALGVILYQLATRRLPVDSEDLIDLFTRMVARDYPSPRELAPDLPQHQEDAILAALEPDPTQRIPSCDVLLAAWRGKIKFEPDSTPSLERTSPFDLAFLRHAEALAGLAVEEPRAVPEVAPPPPPPPPTTQPIAPATLPVGPTATSGNGGRAALVLGGAGAFGALVGGAGLLAVVAIGALVWALRTGEADDPAPLPPAPLPPIAAPAPQVPAPPVPAPEDPEPVVVAPKKPPPPQVPRPRPPPAPTGRVRVTGDATSVWLLKDGRRVTAAPGTVPVGVYQVEAEFPARGKVQTPLSVAIVPGEQLTIDCKESFGTCRIPQP